MILICPNCGKINEVKQKKWNMSHLRVRCRHCGYETTVQVGITSHSPETYRCTACGSTQAVSGPCLKCGASPGAGIPRRAGIPDRAESPGREAAIPPRTKVLKFLMVGLAILVLLTAGILAATLFMIRGSQAYKAAESYIRTSEEIRAAVGNEPRLGLFPAGSIQTTGGRGTAEFFVQVTGSRGKTEVQVTLRLENNRWKVVSAVFTDRSGKQKRITGG